MNIKLVAISGWRRSGKDTAAEIIEREFFAKRISFAEPLKDEVSRIYSLDRASLDIQDLKEKPLLHLRVSPSDAFAKGIADLLIGEFRTEGGHSKRYAGVFGETGGNSPSGYLGYNGLDDSPAPLYWTPRALMIFEGSSRRSVDSNYWVSQALNKIKKPGVYVISDLRYRSEVERLKQWAAEVNADLSVIRINRFATCESADASERDLDSYRFDNVISNTGTIENLEDALMEILTP